MQHRPAPHHGLFRLDQKAHAHHLQPVGVEGQDAVVFDARAALRAQHHRHVGAVDVRVEQADGCAEAVEGDGEVDGAGGLAHAALAGGDGEGVAERQIHLRPDARVADDVGVELDRHVYHARNGQHRFPALALDPAPQRAGGRGQHHGELYRAIADFQIANHVQRDEVAMELGFLHPREGIQNFVLGWHNGFLSCHELHEFHETLLRVIRAIRG